MNIISEEDFNKFVSNAISELPEKFKEKLKNVSIFIKDNPENNVKQDKITLGLYEGIPNPYKNTNYTFALPDKITLYKNNIEKIAVYRNIRIEDVIKEVLYHEVGHHFGFSEEELSNYNVL
jgi:predicted Zn-dependent protease with MMP-like domain